MDSRRIIESLDELDYPMIQPINLGELIIAILQQKDPRKIYSIPYLILRVIENQYEPRHYLLRLLQGIGDDEIRRALIELIGITLEIIKKDEIPDDKSSLNFRNIASEIVPIGMRTRIRDAYRDQKNFTLSTGVTINLSSAERNLMNYETRRNMRAHSIEERPLKEEFRTQYMLSHLFAPRQKDILMKRYLEVPLTKTDEEYYSRVIKKKIDAILNPDIRSILEKARVHKSR